MSEIEMPDKRSRDTRMSIVFFVPNNRTPSVNWAFFFFFCQNEYILQPPLELRVVIKFDLETCKWKNSIEVQERLLKGS